MEQNDFSALIKDVCRSVTGKQKRAKIEEELLGHLEDTYERNKLIGKSDEDAKNEAIAALGDLDVLRERLGAIHSYSHAQALSGCLKMIDAAFILSIRAGNSVFFFLSGILMMLALARLRTVNNKLNISFLTFTFYFIISSIFHCISVCAPPVIATYVFLPAITILFAATWRFLLSGMEEMQKTYCKNEEKQLHFNLFTAFAPLSVLAIGIYQLVNGGRIIKNDSAAEFILLMFYGVAVGSALTQISRLSKRLGDVDAQYGVSPLRKIPAALSMVFLFCTVCPMIFMYTASTRTPAISELVIHDLQDGKEAEEIRENLKKLGLPENVLESLPDSEILRYKGALHMEKNERYLNDMLGTCEMRTFDFYFAGRDSENNLKECRVRTLVQIHPLNKGKKHFYRSGVYHQCPENTKFINRAAEPEIFISVQQKQENKVYIQNVTVQFFDETSTFGAEFRQAKNQTVYLAFNNIIASPYEDFEARVDWYLYVYQTLPFAVDKYKTLTEYMMDHEDYLDYNIDFAFSAIHFMPNRLYQRGFIGITEEELSEHLNKT